MLPIDFPERNRILHGPRDENGKPTSDILDLPSFSNGKVCVCCWQLNDEEKACLKQSKAIWIHLWYPQIDPIYISTICPIKGDDVTVQPINLDILYQDSERSITCWELADEEIELIQTFGVIWFTIESGKTQPPVGFSVLSPFIQN